MKRRAELRRGASMARGGRIKPKKRSASEFARIYGSVARVAWVKSLPCLVASWGCGGPIENAHAENGGMGRKADAETVVPLCRSHHAVLHAVGVASFQAAHALDLTAEARRIAAAWEARCAA